MGPKIYFEKVKVSPAKLLGNVLLSAPELFTNIGPGQKNMEWRLAYLEFLGLLASQVPSAQGLELDNLKSTS